jgi:hypothetical protein
MATLSQRQRWRRNTKNRPHPCDCGNVPDTPGGVALRRILVGPTCPCREDARMSGCSHVAILKADKRLRELFRLPPTALLVE